MKHLLITGFDPFDGMALNPSWEAVSRLPDRVGDYILHKQQLPTCFGKAFEAAASAAERCGADVILCVGVAQGRAEVCVERVAINLRDARIPDNDGCCPTDAPCVPGGPAAYFSNLPVKAMSHACGGKVSLSAGSFVCNDTLYSLLHFFRERPVRVGFVHIPQLPSQTDGPALPLEASVEALRSVILALDG